MNNLLVALKLARREMRSGLSGFRIFMACLVLGVAAVACVGSISAALLAGLAQEGRTILGGDVAVQLVHRTAAADELAFLTSWGRVSETASMRAMAYALKDGRKGARRLIELKAVDRAYPLYGNVGLDPERPIASALACAADACGAIVEDTLLDRLGARAGTLLKIGSATFRVTAVVTKEPDRIAGGFSLGPHVLISDTALGRTGLVIEGSLITYDYRLALPRRASIDRFKSEAAARFPNAGWEIRDRDNPAAGLRRFIEQVTMFLTLVGLTTLAVGGVGAGQAVGHFLDRKRDAIATLKAVGAEGRLVFRIYFIQVMAVAVAATVLGVVLGALIPFPVEALLATRMPVTPVYGIYPEPLAAAALFGMLSAAAFSIPPLGRAREITPAGLFRDIVAPQRRFGRLPDFLWAGLFGGAIVAIALALSPSPSFAGWFMAGAAAILALLGCAAWSMRAVLGRLPRPRHPGLRLAVANVTRPGSTARSVVVGLGLGLTLLATVTLIDRTIAAQVQDELPAKAPSFFFVDILPDQAAAFDSLVAHFPTAADYKRTPMIRGRITALNDVPAAQIKAAASARWVLNGDRGITYAAAEPSGTMLMAGTWWPAAYRGPTLISFDGDLAAGLHLKLGDTITLNVLGRELTGHIANFRHVNFMNGNQNFVLILSPGVVDKAPHSFLATVRVAAGQENRLYRAVTDTFPTVSTVRVRDAIAEIDTLLQELSDGMRAASILAILAGLFVLAGAVAAGQRARLYDATVMKVLGATRAQIVGVYALEYALIGASTGAIALAAGTAAADAVAAGIFAVPLTLDWNAVLLTVVGGCGATLGFGLFAAWWALAARPAEQLRRP